MKTLKFDHDQAALILSGDKTSTWRLNDDKNLSVNDTVRFIDKADPARPETWKVFGEARIERIIEKRLGDVTEADMVGHETFASKEDMLEYYQNIFNNDVSFSTPIKLISFSFLGDKQVSDVSETTLFKEKVKVFADGGSRGNPGPSASGFVLLDPDTNIVLVDRGVYIGVTTNNQAEYLALKYALEEAAKMGAREVDAYMDSLLVVNQLRGTFKVRNRDLFPIHDAVKTLINGFQKFSITHVPREMNKLADAAVNRAMDEALGVERPTHADGQNQAADHGEASEA
jgi:ribonuclease HI